MHRYDTLYDTLARIWGTPRKVAKLRAYRAAMGLDTPHPAADRALLCWLLGNYPPP